MYQHHNWQGEPLDLPVNKVVCVGKNYADHVQEMGGQAPQQPLLFIKPDTALCDIRRPVVLPTGFGEVHYEVEMAILLGSTLKQATEQQAKEAIAGYGIALDLTLREIQAACKKGSEPWEKAKAFDGACPISGFIPADEFGDAQHCDIVLTINGEVRQKGNTKWMIHPILPLIAYMSQFFTLRAGDIILTGTPSGVGPLNPNDRFTASLNGREISSRVL